MHDAAAEAFRLSLHSRVAIRRVHVEHTCHRRPRVRVSRPAPRSAWRRNAIKRPLIRVPDEEIIYRFQLSRVLPAGTDTASMIALNRTLYERARDMGGYRMTSSAVVMSQDDWKRHCGPAWQTVQAAKTKFDPKNVLTGSRDVSRLKIEIMGLTGRAHAKMVGTTQMTLRITRTPWPWPGRKRDAA